MEQDSAEMIQSYQREYQRRKRLANRICISAILIMLALLAGLYLLGQVQPEPSLPTVSEMRSNRNAFEEYNDAVDARHMLVMIGMGIYVVSMITLAAWAIQNWRCPRCDVWLGRGAKLSYCQRCGVLLDPSSAPPSYPPHPR